MSTAALVGATGAIVVLLFIVAAYWLGYGAGWSDGWRDGLNAADVANQPKRDLLP